MRVRKNDEDLGRQGFGETGVGGLFMGMAKLLPGNGGLQ